MKHGYLVDAAAPGNGTCRIPGQFGRFQQHRDLGPGLWQWSGTVGGAFRDRQKETGRYYEGSDGGIYFVPDGGPVDELASAVALWPPGTQAAKTSSGSDPALLENEADLIVEEIIRADGKAAFLVHLAQPGGAKGAEADLGAVLERGGLRLEDVTINGELTGTARLSDGREMPFSGIELTLLTVGTCPRCAAASDQ